MRKPWGCWLLLGLLAASSWGAGALPAPAQALSPQVLALYPVEAGELVFVDLQAARRSPHYAQLKAQVLPERYRELEAWSAQLGVSFDRDVDRLSWAFISTGDPTRADFVGMAEGIYSLDEVRKKAAAATRRVAAYRGAAMYLLGENELGQEFVFAFLDNARLVFGYRQQVEGMVARIREGGGGLLDNAPQREQVETVNGRAPVWLVLDAEFTQLGIRQFLGEAASFPGVETLAQRVRSATVRFQLDRSLHAVVGARCASAADALWFAGFLEAAPFLYRQRLHESNPTLARVLREARLQRSGAQLNLSFSIPESDLVVLLQGRSFTLNF